MIYRKLFVALFVVTLLGSAALVHGQTSTRVVWTQPELLGGGWWNNVTVDATGTAHIGWYGSIEDTRRADMVDLLMYTNRPPNGETPPPIDAVVASISGYTVRNAFDVDSHGILHAFYRASTSHVYARVPADKAMNANEWTGQKTISGGYYLDLLVDRDDNIHLVSSAQGENLLSLELESEGQTNLSQPQLEERFPCAFCADLLYYRSEDGGKNWSPKVNISRTINGSERPQIFQGDSGRIYIAWSEGVDWYTGRGQYEDARFVYSDDDGDTWQGPVILNGGEDSKMLPTQFTLAEFGDSALMAVWRDGAGADQFIYYQISEDLGETWTVPTAVPFIVANSLSASTLDRYELLVDLQGIVHLFAVGYDLETNIGPALYELEYRQQRWVPPTRIFYDATISQPEWPEADVGPQNDLHLTFFVRAGNGVNAADVGDLYVYYAKRPGNMTNRPLLAAYAPTLTPPPQPTKAPEFVPTATLLPTLAPLDPNLAVDTNQDLYAIQTLLGAVLVVGLLCVVVLFLAGFRPRL